VYDDPASGRSVLAHVNRRFGWHIGRLYALKSQANVIANTRHREAVQRIISAEIKDVDWEYNIWRDAYARSQKE